MSVQFINPFFSRITIDFITEILLPSIKTIIKPTSYVCYESRPFTINDSHFVTSNINENRTNDVILNLDDVLSTASQFNDLSSYDTNDADGQPDKYLNTSNESNESDSFSTCSNAMTTNSSEKDDKKIYPCLLCDKKYSTMTNIYRHVRAQHNCFLCSLCMNMFKWENELKEHIHHCPKSDVKKPQCIVCMQYFSNSWSLTRHIKIHISAGEW